MPVPVGALRRALAKPWCRLQVWQARYGSAIAGEIFSRETTSGRKSGHTGPWMRRAGSSAHAELGSLPQDPLTHTPTRACCSGNAHVPEAWVGINGEMTGMSGGDANRPRPQGELAGPIRSMTPSKVYLTTAANGPIMRLQQREQRRNDPATGEGVTGPQHCNGSTGADCVRWVCRPPGRRDASRQLGDQFVHPCGPNPSTGRARRRIRDDARRGVAWPSSAQTGAGSGRTVTSTGLGDPTPPQMARVSCGWGLPAVVSRSRPSAAMLTARPTAP